MTAFLKTQNGELLNLATVNKLHVDYANANVGDETMALFADRHLLSKPHAKTTEADLDLMLEILGLTLASPTNGHGIFSIKKGKVHQQTLNGSGPALVMHRVGTA